jgi:LysM repeat protein
MHRDVKLGLALGILIIGFAAAFCFPRRAVEEVAATPMVGPKLALVDSDIRELRVRSFVGEELNPAPEPTPADDGVEESSVSAGLESLTDAPRFEGAAAAPEPIPLQPKEPDEASVAAVAAVDAESGEVPGVADVLTPEEERLYTVQPGDTLSRIASKLMGSAGKYGVLFEANKGILKSPGALQPGMVLKIPMTEQQEAAVAIGQRTEATVEPPVSTISSLPAPQPNPIPGGPARMASSLADEISTTPTEIDAATRAEMFRKAGAVPFTTGGRRRDGRDE